jgi:hypothetical protein
MGLGLISLVDKFPLKYTTSTLSTRGLQPIPHSAIDQSAVQLENNNKNNDRIKFLQLLAPLPTYKNKQYQWQNKKSSIFIVSEPKAIID